MFQHGKESLLWDLLKICDKIIDQHYESDPHPLAQAEAEVFNPPLAQAEAEVFERRGLVLLLTIKII